MFCGTTQVKFIFPNAPNIPITIVRTGSTFTLNALADILAELWHANAWMV
jgi:hypothetical protein